MQTKEKAHKSLVRPTLEYACTTWDPYLNLVKEEKNRIEMVQRRAARYVVNRYHNTSSVTSMLEELKWPTLEERRQRARLVLMYKIVNGLVKFDATDRFVQLSRLSRNMSQHSFQIPSCNKIIRRSHSTQEPSGIGTLCPLTLPLPFLIKLIKLFLLAHLFCTTPYC